MSKRKIDTNLSPLGKVVLIQPLSFYLLTACALFSALSILASLHFIVYSKKVQVVGVLLPEKGLIKIQSPRSGTVTERKVSEGQFVKAGDILYVLSSDVISTSPKTSDGKIGTSAAILDSLKTMDSSLRDEHTQFKSATLRQQYHLQSQRDNLGLEIKKVDQEIEIQQKKIESVLAQYQRYVSLENQGYFSSLAMHQKNNDLLDQQARMETISRSKLSMIRELANANNELALLKDKSDHEQAQYDRQLLESDRNKVTTQSSGEIYITSPQSGKVAAILVEPGQMVSNQTLLTVLPENSSLEAHIYVPGSAVGFVNVGDRLALRIAAYPHLKFGKIEGTVVEVSQTSISTPDMSGQLSSSKVTSINSTNEAMFRLKVKLSKQYAQSQDQKKILLSGMELDTEIVQETRTLLQWIFEPLYRLQDNL